MPNTFFQFKQFVVLQDKCAMKVCTDSCLFGAWVAKQISTPNATILDIGTGTGLLSLMLQQHLPLAEVLGIDIDTNAIDQATQNTKGFTNVKIKQTNVLEMEADLKYDAIICNPPFYENQLQSPQKSKNLAHHALSLSHKSLSAKMAALLANNGQVFVLLPYFIYKNFVTFALQQELYVQKTVLVKQTPTHPYFRAMLEFGFKAVSKPKQETIYIKNDENEYSKEFVCYLKPYYLYF